MEPATPSPVPMNRVIATLATEYDVPGDALAAAVARIDEAAPILMEVLNRAAGQGLRQERDRVLLFRALPILAATRHVAACKPLLRLLRRPEEEVDAALGDLVTETLPRIVASVFDGDAGNLLVACGDSRISESARWSLLLAVAFLAWSGRIDRGEAHAFLLRFHDARLAPRHDAAWLGWAEAVGLLGMADLAPAVEAVLAGFPPQMDQRPRFREALADAAAAPRDAERFRAANTGTIDNVMEAFDWVGQAGGTDEGAGWEGPQPIVNPLRGVGRNDPCPCGSGRKYKKCCLPAA